MSTIIGNVLVILSVFSHRPLRTAQNFFIVSLAVADLTVAVLVLPFSLINYILGKWTFGSVVCKIWLTCDILCCTASIMNLCAIAVDRYYAITNPINYAGKRSVKRVCRTIAGIWIVSAIISSPPLAGWNDWQDSLDDSCHLTTEPSYIIYSASGSFYIPLLVMTVVYVKIFFAARKRIRKRAAKPRCYSLTPAALAAAPASDRDDTVCCGGDGCRTATTAATAAGSPRHSPFESESNSGDLTSCLYNARNSFRLVAFATYVLHYTASVICN